MSTALADPTTLTDTEIEQAIAALLAEQSSRKPADAPLAAGDRVEVTGDLTPRYIIGRVGTITKINKATADVTLDDTTRVNPRYIAPDGTVRIPMECITRR